jgi:hypothetical protein
LRPRSAGNPDIARRHNDEFPGRQVISMVLECLIQMFDFLLHLGPGKPEEQNASVGKPLIENQLAEIPVGNDEDPLLLPREIENSLIRKTRRVVA